MYRVNPLKRKVLITTDEVIFHAATAQTIDPRTLQQAIIIAEERIIRNALGFDFYETLRTSKNKTVTSLNKATLEALINASLGSGVEPVVLAVGDMVNASEFLSEQKLLLWNEYLWKLTAEVVRFVALPQNYASFTSTGIIHNHPGIMGGGLSGGAESTPELKSIKWMIDRALSDAIDPLMEAMHVWLCKMRSSGLYAGYQKRCDCNANGVAYQRKADILLGIYDDDEDEGCGCGPSSAQYNFIPDVDPVFVIADPEPDPEPEPDPGPDTEPGIDPDPAPEPEPEISESILFYEDFEGETPLAAGVSIQNSTEYGLNIGSYNGRNTARFELRQGDPEASGGTRSELLFPQPTETPVDRWYSFRMFFPATGWQTDSAEEIVTQFHQGGGLSPSIAIETKADAMRLRVRPDTDLKFTYPLGPVAKDTWLKFKMHIIHSHGSDGLIEIWQDDIKLITLNGANSYDFADYDKPKWKIGIYKWKWNDGGETDTVKRILFIDDIKMGNALSTFSEM